MTNKNFMIPTYGGNKAALDAAVEKADWEARQEALPADLRGASDEQLFLAVQSYDEMLASPLDFGKTPMVTLRLKAAVIRELRKRGHEINIDD